jgi:hypothetical protein
VSTVNARNPEIDQTVQIFDQFYSYDQAVSASEYDAVYSYLRSVFNTAGQAGNFTSTLFRISAASGIPAMELLQSLQGLAAPQITLTFAYYLNTFQSPSTMIGLQAPTVPNFYVAHNIKQ